MKQFNDITIIGIRCMRRYSDSHKEKKGDKK